MSKATGFHVRHDLQPQLTRELLALLRTSDQHQTETELQQLAEERGYRLRERKSYNKLIRSLSELGILEVMRGTVGLTELGRSVTEITEYYPHLLSEFIHFLYYSAWERSEDNRFSWSYREVCNWLWDSAPCVIDRDRLVTVVTERASQEFEEQGISFSTSSVTGILNWVTELQPPNINTEKGQPVFSRRLYCSVETFALALNLVYRRYVTNDSLYISLSPALRRETCRIGLISESAFDEMLDQTEASFGQLDIHRERGGRFAMSNFSWECLKG